MECGLALDVSGTSIFLKPAAPQPAVKREDTDNQKLLNQACNGDEKCVCINNAIFKHDSSWATKGVGARAKNPCNMRMPSTWEPTGIIASTQGAVGHFAVYDSLENGINGCVELYSRFYADLDPYTLTTRWAQTHDKNYHNAVASCF